MGNPRSPELVNYVAHVFTAGDSEFWLETKNLKQELEYHFGPIDYISPIPMDFQKHTFYYNEEMGENIKIEGRMIGFRNLGSQAFLSKAKIITNKIEDRFAIDGKRKVNVDIGFIHHTQFVLASTKHRSNRIYIGDDIYAEITLTYSFNKWVPNEHSYENFKDVDYQKELEVIRKLYMQKRKNLGK